MANADEPGRVIAAVGAPGGRGHAHEPNRREYWKIFGVLAVLTGLEVGVAQVPGITRRAMVVALITLALAKAACVGLYFMHLKSETRMLRATVFLPFAVPALYAIVLISEAAWRLAGG